jgi:D-sedoheptulose 7-phosphate isomerase
MNAPDLNDPIQMFLGYTERVQRVLKSADLTAVRKLALELLDCWQTGRQVFLCGNGGSAGNAIHLANDFMYGISKTVGQGLKATALPANAALLTCLANDVSYDEIYSAQLAVLASPGDVLIALSGSGNSPNILRSLTCARERGVKSFAILGFSGGKAKELADVPIHFQVEDMQISEDMQVIVGHMIMQWLFASRSRVI